MKMLNFEVMPVDASGADFYLYKHADIRAKLLIMLLVRNFNDPW